MFKNLDLLYASFPCLVLSLVCASWPKVMPFRAVMLFHQLMGYSCLLKLVSRAVRPLFRPNTPTQQHQHTHTHILAWQMSVLAPTTLCGTFRFFFFFCFFLLFLELREWIFLFANVRGKLVLGVGGWAKSFNTLFPVVVDFAYKLTYKLIFRSAKVLSFFELSMWANRWDSCKII